MKEAGSVELKAGILDFLKKYNDMSSGKHIMTNIKAVSYTHLDVYKRQSAR